MGGRGSRRVVFVAWARQEPRPPRCGRLNWTGSLPSSRTNPTMRLPAFAALLTAATLLLSATPAPAVFNKPISLQNDALREELIFVAACESVAPEKAAVVFKSDEKLKGDPPFEKLTINLTGNADAQKANHTQIMLDRLEPGRKMIAFSSKRGKKYNAVAFMEGTWFSLQGS